MPLSEAVLDQSEDGISDEIPSSAFWESTDSMEHMESLKNFSPPPPYMHPPLVNGTTSSGFDPNRAIKPWKKNVTAPRQGEKSPGKTLETSFQGFFAELYRREQRFKASSEVVCKLPKHILEFAFEKYALASSRLQDEVLFMAFELFKYYGVPRLQEYPFCSKLYLAAGLLLASKENSVRHVPLNLLIELGELQASSKPNIIEIETLMFVSTYGRLSQPTPLTIVRAYFPLTELSSRPAYHLTVIRKRQQPPSLSQIPLSKIQVYLLALNMMENDPEEDPPSSIEGNYPPNIMQLSPLEMGQVASWLAVLLLDVKFTPEIMALKQIMAGEKYYE